MALSRREKKALGVLDRASSTMHDDLSRLVAVNSLTTNGEGVNAVGEILASWLEALGFRMAEVVSGHGGRSLVARRRSESGHRLLLLGHLDTVHPPDPDFASLEPVPGEEGRLRGPGAADMKGGLVVMIHALRALDRAGLLDGRHLTIVLSSDEEVGSPQAADIVRGEALDSHLCLCFEPGRPLAGGASTFVTRRKGMGRLGLEARGVAAHAGVDYERGASAIRELAEKVIALEDLAAPEEGVTVNVGVFKGGTVANTVPAHASMEVDYRYPDKDRGEPLKEALFTEAGRHHVLGADGSPRVSTRIVDQVEVPAMVRTEAMGRMAGRIMRWGAEIGLKLEEEGRGGASDANHAADAGCPAVCGLGAVGDRFHTREEWILEGSLRDRARLAALVINRFYEL